MEKIVKSDSGQIYNNSSLEESIQLAERLKNVVLPLKKIAKAKETLSKIDPEQFKAVTGRDLFKK